MARMPSGQPRSVPDEAGDLYDARMRELRARRQEQEAGVAAPLSLARDALHRFQDGPGIPRPTTLESFIPVVGPAWEAAADLQDGDYAGAAFNAGMAVADALPIGVAAKGLRAASKGVGVLKKGSVTANAAAKIIRARGLAGAKHEIHHTIPLKGTGRTVQDPRNHYALLKVMPKAEHRRLTGSWAGKPRYDPVRRAWYGTTDWMKAVPAGVAGYGADSVENLSTEHAPRGARR